MGALFAVAIGCQAKLGGTSNTAGSSATSESSKASHPGGDHAKLNAEMKAAGVSAEQRAGVIKIIERDVKKWDALVVAECGVSIAVGIEFEQFVGKTPDVSQAMYSCVRVLEGIRNVCSEGDVFKAEVAEKVKQVRCWYEESEEFARTSLASFALEGGTMRMGFGGKTPTNIMTSTQKFLRKSL